ncbi:MAG: hypothetical protein ABI867_21130, partial [Kofleriaceae bacterium]
YPDGTEYMRQLNNKTWKELDSQFFARRSDALSFLGSAHLLSVLPHYLMSLLALEPTSPVPEALLPILTKPEATGPRAHLFEWANSRFEELIQKLSDQQSSTVRTVLEMFVALHPNYAGEAHAALVSYWGAVAH